MTRIVQTMTLAVLIWAPVRPLLAQPAPSADGCVACHADLAEPLAAPAQLFADDIHAASGFSCVDCHGGDPATSDRAAAKDPATGYRGVPTGPAVVETCARCHGDADFMRRFAPTQRVDQAAEYAVSGHGRRLAEGDTSVATCTSCHGPHGIRRVSDAQSPVFPLRVADTCGACHTDPSHMAGHDLGGVPFPTDQLAAYETSAHFEALTVGNDLSAPTCNDCHGSHGATPPGVDAVVNVCGTCHAAFAARYEQSTHAFIFEQGCAQCHDHHAIKAADDAMLAPGSSTCDGCHGEGETGLAVAHAMSASIEGLKAALAQTGSLVERARTAGMEMSEQEVALREARNQLTLARTEVHTFDPAAVTQVVDEGLAQLAAIDRAGLAAMVELRYRRLGLAVSVGLILLFVVALYFKVRELDRRLPPG